jgi:UDP-N-acetylmuramyl pentapeptide phosphotransferase/UDP-N-acetylglucosamine-1-phosphate transferase
MKTHRVGTLTLGGMLIVFGILFLLNIFMATMNYVIIFKLWPIIFIFLGLEILVANFRQKNDKLIYDKTAFALIIVLSFFAMGMAITEFVLENVSNHLTIY